MRKKDGNGSHRRTEYVGTEAAAQYLNLSNRWLEKLRIIGGGPCYFKLGRRCVYRYEDLDAWVESNRRHSTSDIGHGG